MISMTKRSLAEVCLSFFDVLEWSDLQLITSAANTYIGLGVGVDGIL